MVTFYSITKKLPDLPESSFYQENHDPLQTSLLSGKRGWIFRPNIKESQSRAHVIHLCILTNPDAFKYIEKNCCDCGNMEDYWNEYYIALYGLNSLRLLVPNFAYMYTIDRIENNQLKLLQEYVSDMSFHRLLQLIVAEKIENGFQVFLKIIFQLLLALEIGQENLQFCHYDLHLNNILIKTVEPRSLVYKVHNKECTIEDTKYIGVCIDFATSTLSQKKVHFGPISYTGFQIYPFLLPGTDMVRLLFSIYYTLQRSIKISSTKTKMLAFLNYIFVRFFRAEMGLTSTATIKLILEHFGDISFTNQVFLHPYALLDFLQSEEQDLCRTLGIDTLPWCWAQNTGTSVEHSLWKSFHKSPEHQEYSDDTFDLLLEETQIMSVKIPNPFRKHNLTFLQKFLESHAWFIPYYEANYCKESKKYNKKYLITFYRAYNMIEHFVAFQDTLPEINQKYTPDVRYQKKVWDFFQNSS